MRCSPLLEKEEEFQLAKNWKETKSLKAIEKLMDSHLRLVAKIASGYRGYGLPISDLISEGNVGLMLALQNYDPSKGFRLSTYAQWWIKSTINEYIYETWSMVRRSKSGSTRRLFFKLRSAHTRLQEQDRNLTLSPEQIKSLAVKLAVKEDDIIDMYQHLQGRETSLNAQVNNEDGSGEWIDWLQDHRQTPEQEAIQSNEINFRLEIVQEGMKSLNKNELIILQRRRLKDPPDSLHELAKDLCLSPEGVRLIEMRALEKLKSHTSAFMKNKPSFPKNTQLTR